MWIWLRLNANIKRAGKTHRAQFFSNKLEQRLHNIKLCDCVQNIIHWSTVEQS